MAGMNFIYNTFLRRTSTFALTIIGGVFVFERVFDQGADYLFEYLNRGVSNVAKLKGLELDVADLLLFSLLNGILNRKERHRDQCFYSQRILMCVLC